MFLKKKMIHCDCDYGSKVELLVVANGGAGRERYRRRAGAMFGGGYMSGRIPKHGPCDNLQKNKTL